MTACVSIPAGFDPKRIGGGGNRRSRGRTFIFCGVGVGREEHCFLFNATQLLTTSFFTYDHRSDRTSPNESTTRKEVQTPKSKSTTTTFVFFESFFSRSSGTQFGSFLGRPAGTGQPSTKFPRRAFAGVCGLPFGHFKKVDRTLRYPFHRLSQKEPLLQSLLLPPIHLYSIERYNVC